MNALDFKLPKNKLALIDRKGKHDSIWKLNKRTFDSYSFWSKEINMPKIVVFLVFDNDNNFNSVCFAKLKK